MPKVARVPVPSVLMYIAVSCAKICSSCSRCCDLQIKGSRGYKISPLVLFSSRSRTFFRVRQVRGSVLFNTAGGLVSFRKSELPFYLLPVMWFFNSVVGSLRQEAWVEAFADLWAYSVHLAMCFVSFSVTVLAALACSTYSCFTTLCEVSAALSYCL